MERLPTVNDSFWYDDYRILYENQRLLEFVPTAEMNLTEKLNAIVRLSLYLGILMSLIYGSGNYMAIAVLGMTLSLFLHSYKGDNDQHGGATELGWSALDQTGETNPVESDDNGFKYQKPTQDNPFMNVLLTDYVDKPNRPPAGDVQNPEVKQEMEKHFSFGLYRDFNDIWDKNNSQRQYYSNPGTTIPNDRHSFMHWCWNVPYVCKDGDMSACLKTAGNGIY